MWVLFLDADGTVKSHQKISDTQGGFTGILDDGDLLGNSVASMDDLDGDGDYDVFSCEMEGVGGDGPPRWYMWENVDGRGGAWHEHVIFEREIKKAAGEG